MRALVGPGGAGAVPGPLVVAELVDFAASAAPGRDAIAADSRDDQPPLAEVRRAFAAAFSRPAGQVVAAGSVACCRGQVAHKDAAGRYLALAPPDGLRRAGFLRPEPCFAVTAATCRLDSWTIAGTTGGTPRASRELLSLTGPPDRTQAVWARSAAAPGAGLPVFALAPAAGVFRAALPACRVTAARPADRRRGARDALPAARPRPRRALRRGLPRR